MFKNLTIKSRLIFVIGFLAIQLIIGALIGIVSLGFANDATRSMYDDRLVSMEKLERIVRLLSADQLAISKAITADPAASSKLLDEVTQNMQTGAKDWRTDATFGETCCRAPDNFSGGSLYAG